MSADRGAPRRARRPGIAGLYRGLPLGLEAPARLAQGMRRWSRGPTLRCSIGSCLGLESSGLKTGEDVPTVRSLVWVTLGAVARTVLTSSSPTPFVSSSSPGPMCREGPRSNVSERPATWCRSERPCPAHLRQEAWLVCRCPHCTPAPSCRDGGHIGRGYGGWHGRVQHHPTWPTRTTRPPLGGPIGLFCHGSRAAGREMGPTRERVGR